MTWRGAGLAIMLALAGCAGCGKADAARDGAVVHGYSLPEFPGGFAFHTPLPPSFSPFLPLYGEETTREPPGACISRSQ